MTELTWAMLATPVGPVSAACSEAGVARVRFGRPPSGTPDPTGDTELVGSAAPGAAALATLARAQLAEYFSGRRRAFELPVDWSTASGGTRQRVLSALMDTVGFGQTVTYGGLAERAGVRGEVPARVVGQIMASNPYPLVVPCHRVLAGTGLGGFSGGTGVEVKRWLLTFEGALPPTLDWDPAGMADATR